MNAFCFSNFFLFVTVWFFFRVEVGKWDVLMKLYIMDIDRG